MTARDVASARGQGGRDAAKWACLLSAESADGRFLATGSDDHTARLWCMEEVDGSVAESRLTPSPASQVAVRPERIYAGDLCRLDVTVSNTGKGPLHRVWAEVASEDSQFEGTYLLFGKVDPGKGVMKSLGAIVPPDSPARKISLRLVFHEANGYTPAERPVEIDVHPLPRPDVAFRWALKDDGSGNSVGNGDGKVQRGEGIDLACEIENKGMADVTGARLLLTGEAPAGVVVNVAAAELGDLAIGAKGTGRVTFTPRREFEGARLRFVLAVETADGRTMTREAVEIAVEK